MIAKKTKWLLVGLLCLALWPGTAHGQSAELVDLCDRFARLYTQGRFQEALPFAEKALNLGKSELGSDHSIIAPLLNNLAELYRIQGRYAEAEPLYKRSLGIGERTLGPLHPDVATSLNNLALLYHAQNRYLRAEPLYQRSLAIREKVLGSDHPDVATSLSNLAGLYDGQGRYGEAEPLYRRSLEIREKVLGPDHTGVAQTLNNLAEHHAVQGRYAEAYGIRQPMDMMEKPDGLPTSPQGIARRVGQTQQQQQNMINRIQAAWPAFAKPASAGVGRSGTGIHLNRAAKLSNKVGPAQRNCWLNGESRSPTKPSGVG